MDYYKILGLDSSASADDIKKAYRKQAMKHHPDRGGDESQFTVLQEAYDVLGNPNKRAMYDAGGRGSRYSTDGKNALLRKLVREGALELDLTPYY